MGKPKWDLYYLFDLALHPQLGQAFKSELRSGRLYYCLERELKATSEQAQLLSASLANLSAFATAAGAFLRSRTPENTADSDTIGTIDGLVELADLIQSEAFHQNSDWHFSVTPIPQGGGNATIHYFVNRLNLDVEKAFSEVPVPSGVFPHHLMQSDGPLTSRYQAALNVLIAGYPAYASFLTAVYLHNGSGGGSGAAMS